MERDFTNAQINKLRMYGGANGNKISIVYDKENYMLKFPSRLMKNPEMGYINGCFSEYIACHILQTLEINAQETLLGKYEEKITVACKDFAVDGFVLKDFASLKNTIINSMQNGYGTELSDVLNAIEQQQIVSPKKLKEFFWNMFIGDALLGNFNRHNGNWGFLVNDNTGQIKIAPVYDCGSCLYPQLNDEGMKFVLANKDEIEQRMYVFPTSAIKENGVKINYAEFLLTTDNAECHKSLIDIGHKIDLQKINIVIDSTPFISDIHKIFVKTMISERKEKIIDRAVERIMDTDLLAEEKDNAPQKSIFQKIEKPSVKEKLSNMDIQKLKTNKDHRHKDTER